MGSRTDLLKSTKENKHTCVQKGITAPEVAFILAEKGGVTSEGLQHQKDMLTRIFTDVSEVFAIAADLVEKRKAFHDQLEILSRQIKQESITEGEKQEALSIISSALDKFDEESGLTNLSMMPVDATSLDGDKEDLLDSIKGYLEMLINNFINNFSNVRFTLQYFMENGIITQDQLNEIKLLEEWKANFSPEEIDGSEEKELAGICKIVLTYLLEKMEGICQQQEDKEIPSVETLKTKTTLLKRQIEGKKVTVEVTAAEVAAAEDAAKAATEEEKRVEKKKLAKKAKKKAASKASKENLTEAKECFNNLLGEIKACISELKGNSYVNKKLNFFTTLSTRQGDKKETAKMEGLATIARYLASSMYDKESFTGKDIGSALEECNPKDKENGHLTIVVSDSTATSPFFTDKAKKNNEFEDGVTEQLEKLVEPIKKYIKSCGNLSKSDLNLMGSYKGKAGDVFARP